MDLPIKDASVKDKPINDVPVGPLVNIVVILTDTLFSLARIFSVLTIEEILTINPGIVDPNVIFPGQIIRIPSVAPVPPDAPPSSAQYLVRPTDTLFSIAQRFGLTVALLLEVNPQITDPDVISAFQVINLPVTPPLPPQINVAQFYVSVGETLISIARRTGVSLQAIIAANPQITDPDLIFVGQIINVPLGETQIIHKVPMKKISPYAVNMYCFPYGDTASCPNQTDGRLGLAI